MFKNTLIIGLGLIGGSFAKAIAANNLSDKIYACDINEDCIGLAEESGLIAQGFENLTLIPDLTIFDFIVIAAPLSAYGKILTYLSDKTDKKAIVIDLGSVKQLGKELKIKALPVNFIPCHPIAGLENSGFEYSIGDLFVQKKFFICSEECDASRTVKLLAESMGAIPEFIDAKKHDEIYALVSHLPQFISFLTKEFSPSSAENPAIKQAFRLDNSSPEIWRDIFRFNDQNLEKFYLDFFVNLEELFELAKQDSSKLAEILLITKIDFLSFKAEGFVENLDFSKEGSAILFRLIIVVAFLQLKKIKEFLQYSGSGFRDFISIIFTLPEDKNLLIQLIKQFYPELQTMLKQIS